MPCCMVSKDNLGRPPRWLQRLFLKHAVHAASSRAAHRENESAVPYIDLPERAIDLIGQLSGLPVTEDPP